MILYILLAALCLSQFLILLRLSHIEESTEQLHAILYHFFEYIKKRDAEDDEEDGPEDGPEPDELEEALLRAARGPIMPLLGELEAEEEAKTPWTV